MNSVVVKRNLAGEVLIYHLSDRCRSVCVGMSSVPETNEDANRLLPGNLMTFAGIPLWFRHAASWVHCVDLPDRSRPSTTMNNAERQQPVL